MHCNRSARQWQRQRDQISYMIVACLTIERAAEAPFEDLRSSDGELGGRLGFCYRDGTGKREDDGEEEGDL